MDICKFYLIDNMRGKVIKLDEEGLLDKALELFGVAKGCAEMVDKLRRELEGWECALEEELESGLRELRDRGSPESTRGGAEIYEAMIGQLEDAIDARGPYPNGKPVAFDWELEFTREDPGEEVAEFSCMDEEWTDE